MQRRRAGALQTRDEDDLAKIDIMDFGALPQELLNAQATGQGAFELCLLYPSAQRREFRLRVYRFDQDCQGFEKPLVAKIPKSGSPLRVRHHLFRIERARKSAKAADVIQHRDSEGPVRLFVVRRCFHPHPHAPRAVSLRRLRALRSQRIEFAQPHDSSLRLRMRLGAHPAEAHGARSMACGVDPVGQFRIFVRNDQSYRPVSS